MFNYKTNKQAFIIAALIILLCLICLVGATFALFTGDVNDGTIGIVATSGDVEIDIVDINGVTLQGRSLAFITSSANKDPEFEPGATFYTQGFKVTNEGDVPVNFILSISKDDNPDREAIEEAFEIWIVKEDQEGNRSAEHITDFKGSLKVGDDSGVYYLYIKMKETAGNEFQDKQYTGIGITVYATQGNVEIRE